MILEVRHFRVLDAVRRAGSVSGAARLLHLTQPAVSHALRDMRQKLGVELFRRTDGLMVPTAEGKRLLETGDVVLAEVARAEEDLRRFRSGETGQLRLATECYTCYHWLPRLIGEFRQTHSGIELTLVPEATEDPFRALLDARLDVAMVYSRPRQRRIELSRLFTDEIVAVVSPESPLAERSYLNARDFAGQHLIFHSDPGGSLVTTEVLEPGGVSPARVSELKYTGAVIETVRAGLGITTMARWSVAPQLESGEVVAVRITRGGLVRDWHAAYVSGARKRPALDRLVELLATRSSSMVEGYARRGTSA